MTNASLLRRALLGAAFLLLPATFASAQQIAITADHADGIYHSGETAHWTIEWKGDGAAPAAHYELKSGGLKQVGDGDLQFNGNTATLDAKLGEPNTMLLAVTWEPQSEKNRATSGVVADPDQIQPAAKCPDDFDAFWQSKLDELAKVPANAKLEEADGGKSGVGYWKITMDNIRGTHIEGELARPVSGEKFPAILIVQWAGVYGLQKKWVTDYAAQGWLALDIEPHDIPIDKDRKFYKDLYDGPLKNYWMIGNDNRDTSYYLRMYMSAVQALHYLKSRPDWNGKTIVVTGNSQGGQQTLMLAGLCPDEVSAGMALVPAACDVYGPSIGRASGFPDWWNQTGGGRDAEKVHEASKYYDPCNFAARIKCPMLVAFGLRDETAPPSSVLAAVNQIKGPKEVMILAKSGHQDEHGTQEPYMQRLYGAWVPALAKGEMPPVGH